MDDKTMLVNRLHQYIGKASFSHGADQHAARTILDEIVAQPSGVVLPELMAVPGQIWKDARQPYGNPLNHAEIKAAESFNLAISEIARLNSSPVSAGGADEREALPPEPYPVLCGYACVSLNKKGDLHIVVDSTERLANARSQYWREQGYVSAVKPVTVPSDALARAAINAGSAVPDWGVFASYLLDRCEGDTISEEGLQRALHSMVHDPHYGPLFRGEKASAVPDGWQPSGIEYDRGIHHNPDAKAWADLFVATFPALADKHDLMLGWFANAMMAMHDFLKAKQPNGEVLDWAVERWHAEVSQRPLINVHRRALDGAWRQVIRKLGGDPVDLCGPDHSTLLASAPIAQQEGGDV